MREKNTKAFERNTKAFERNKNREKRIKKFILMQQEGIGVVEIILILVIIIALVLLFRTAITSLVQNVLARITSDTSIFN